MIQGNELQALLVYAYCVADQKPVPVYQQQAYDAHLGAQKTAAYCDFRLRLSGHRGCAKLHKSI